MAGSALGKCPACGHFIEPVHVCSGSKKQAVAAKASPDAVVVDDGMVSSGKPYIPRETYPDLGF